MNPNNEYFMKKPFKVNSSRVKNRKKIACLKTCTVSKNKYYLINRIIKFIIE